MRELVERIRDFFIYFVEILTAIPLPHEQILLPNIADIDYNITRIAMKQFTFVQ
jgi:hypothetical protein